MARYRIPRSKFNRLTKKWEKAVAEAFWQSIQGMTSGAQVRALEAALEANDISRVLQILQIGPDAFRPLDDTIRDAFRAGGVAALAGLPKPLLTTSQGARLAVYFDGRNPRAEKWAAQMSSRLIVEIAEDQKKTIRAVVKAGLDAGQNPRTVALDIVGRMDRGRRRGGIVGLHSQFAGHVQTAKAELADPANMANYLTRQRRDRRFDSIVSRAIKDGRAVSQSDIDRISARYADRLLQTRGNNIARTEALSALTYGQDEGLEQLIATGQIKREQVTYKWQATMDSKTRDDHVGLDGQTVTIGEAFTSPTGARLKHPRDTSLGAGGEDVINCRCYAEPNIDYIRPEWAI